VTGDGNLGVGQAKCILANKLFYPFQPNALSLDINSFLEMGLISGIFIKQLGESF